MFESITALLLIGALLLFVEMFVPGMIAGIAGGLALLAAVILTYVHYGATAGHMVLGGVAFGGLVGFLWWLKAFPKSRAGQLFALKAEVGGEEHFHAFEELNGRDGRALTQLRPSGTAIIDGRRVDVVTEGNIVESGSTIRVVQVAGNRVVVRPQ